MDIAEQLRIGTSCAKEITPLKLGATSRLIICGMGGSIMPAEALAMLWPNQPPIYINRTAYLPPWADSRQTVICISWSGNTAETVACLKEAIDKKIPAGVIATEGKLADLAKKNSRSLVLLPSHGLNPRDALGIMFSALLTLISRSDIIENSVNSSSFRPAVPEDLAKNLAAEIGSKTPLLYSSCAWRWLGSFWKIFFNENAKIHAFFNFMPGAGHNEIAGIKAKDPLFFYLLLRDPQDRFEDIKKIDQLEKFLKSRPVDHIVISLRGEDRFDKIINQYLLAAAVSTALAHQLGVDPRSTATIESFKQLS